MAEVKIGDRVFRTTELPAPQAFELYFKVVGFLGPAAAEIPILLYTANHETEESKIFTDAALFEAFGKIVMKNGPEKVRALIEEIISLADIYRPSGEYSQADMSADFAGNFTEIVKLCLFVLREQFRPFTSGPEGSGLFHMIAVAFREMK